MEQSLDCRTDFLQAAGMPALLSRLEHGRRPIRQLAAACIRTSCINCPPNRDAVHEAQVEAQVMQQIRHRFITAFYGVVDSFDERMRKREIYVGADSQAPGEFHGEPVLHAAALDHDRLRNNR